MPGGHAEQEAQGGSHRHGQPVGTLSSARSEVASHAIHEHKPVREGGVPQALQEGPADVGNGVKITPLYNLHGSRQTMSEQERILPWIGDQRMQQHQLPHKPRR